MASPASTPARVRAGLARTPLLVLAVAGGLLIISAPQLAVRPSLGAAITWLVLAIAGGASLAHPVISCTAIAVLLTAAAPSDALPVGLGVLSAPIAVGACAARASARAVALLSAWILAALVAATIVDARGIEDVASGAGVWAGLLAAAAVIGRTMGRSRRRRDAALAAQRRALALELHDTALRATTEVVMRAESTRLRPGIAPGEAAALADLAASARDAVLQLRASLDSIDPMPRPAGIREAAAKAARAMPRIPSVSALVEEHLGALGLRGFDVRVVMEPMPLLSAPSAIALDRALAEVRANIVRHADPTAPVRVRVHADAGLLRIRIANRTGGASDPALSGGRGLAGIRSRLQPLGGDVATELSDSTHITELTVPLRTADDARSIDCR